MGGRGGEKAGGMREEVASDVRAEVGSRGGVSELRRKTVRFERPPLVVTPARALEDLLPSLGLLLGGGGGEPTILPQAVEEGNTRGTEGNRSDLAGAVVFVLRMVVVVVVRGGLTCEEHIEDDAGNPGTGSTGGALTSTRGS